MDAKMYSTWSILELKTELKRRGASVRGRKADLIERLELYDKNFNFNMPQLSPNPAESSIVLPPLEMYHDINSNSILPPLERQCIRYYFERFNKKIDASEKLYEARFLILIRSAFVDEHFYIKGFVKKTMKKLSYQVDIKIDDQGGIEECHCECPAGAGKEAHCKHVGVVLFAVLHMRRDKIILITESQTQQLQTFHRPKKIFTGTPVKAQDLTKRRYSKNVIFEAYPMNSIDNVNYNNRIRNLILNLNSNMPMKQLYPPANPIAVSQDHDYLKDTPDMLLLKNLNLLEITTDQIKAIENETRNQNSNSLWHEYRNCRITASVFHTVCNLRVQSLQSFAKQLLKPKRFSSRATAHGYINEPNALKKYSDMYDLVPVQCGMFISKDRPYLSASPDALLGEDTVIEIKCPYVSRNRLISPESVPYIQTEGENLILKKTCPYYYQVQGQMYCSGRKFCNFIIYTFKDMKVIYIEKDELFINNMLLKLDNFYNNYMKTEIINKYMFKDYFNIIKTSKSYFCVLFTIHSRKLHNIKHIKNIFEAKGTFIYLFILWIFNKNIT